MKSLMYLFICCICLCSCNSFEKETNCSFDKVEEFTYKGHDYIKFAYGLYGCGVVHDPECKMCKEHN